MPRKATLYRNTNPPYTGEALDLSDFAPVLPPPLGNGDGETSSFKLYVREWIIFCEGKFFNGDQLWFEGPTNVPDLHTFGWGDRIQSVLFAPITRSAPDGKTITDPSGKRVGVTIVRKSGRTSGSKPIKK